MTLLGFMGKAKGIRLNFNACSIQHFKHAGWVWVGKGTGIEGNEGTEDLAGWNHC